MKPFRFFAGRTTISIKTCYAKAVYSEQDDLGSPVCLNNEWSNIEIETKQSEREAKIEIEVFERRMQQSNR
jgi:hypothetical protein